MPKITITKEYKKHLTKAVEEIDKAAEGRIDNTGFVIAQIMAMFAMSCEKDISMSPDRCLELLVINAKEEIKRFKKGEPIL